MLFFLYLCFLLFCVLLFFLLVLHVVCFFVCFSFVFFCVCWLFSFVLGVFSFSCFLFIKKNTREQQQNTNESQCIHNFENLEIIEITENILFQLFQLFQIDLKSEMITLTQFVFFLVSLCSFLFYIVVISFVFIKNKQQNKNNQTKNESRGIHNFENLEIIEIT